LEILRYSLIFKEIIRILSNIKLSLCLLIIIKDSWFWQKINNFILAFAKDKALDLAVFKVEID
jgi:hypothetical protein